MFVFALFVAVFCAVNSSSIPRPHLVQADPAVLRMVQDRQDVAGTPWQGAIVVSMGAADDR